jgi:hypothetical protein
VLSHSDVLLNRSLSHCVSQENHLEYHIISTLYTEENRSHGLLTLFHLVSERTTHPTHGIPHPTQGHTTFHLCLREEPHTHLMGTPNSWASSPHTRGTQRSISVSERNNTPISWAHPTHGLPHPTQGHTTFHLRLREEQHTHIMGTPNSWDSSQDDSPSLCPGGHYNKSCDLLPFLLPKMVLVYFSSIF